MTHLEVLAANGYHHRIGYRPGPRRAALDDIDFLVDLAAELYDQPFNRPSVRLWLQQVIRHPNYLVMLTENAAVVAFASPPAFDPTHPDCRILYLLGRRIWDVVRLLRLAAQWASMHGARELHLSAVNGVDIEPLARRLKAVEDPMPSYVISLGG